MKIVYTPQALLILWGGERKREREEKKGEQEGGRMEEKE